MADHNFHPDRLQMLRYGGGQLGDASDSDMLDYGSPGEAPRRVTGSNNEPLGTRGAAYCSEATPALEDVHVTTLSGAGAGQQPPPPPFDFGSGMPLPPSKPKEPHRSRKEALEQKIRSGSLFQKLGNSQDRSLYAYLRRRRITPGFLHEIDKLLANHPEIAEYAPAFVHKFNECRPLDAYKYFLIGYTKPARYLTGHLPEGDFVLPWSFKYEPLVNNMDEELSEFFAGREYRWDILQEIDYQVVSFIQDIQAGRNLKRNDRQLVVYAVWGNPVDAYKYYEYNYQTKWLPHRYLAEHVILSEMPRDETYTAPEPHVIGEDEGRRDHYFVRLKMARAADAGVDVLDVLLSEFTAELAKKGHTRDDIERGRREAKDAIDAERENPAGHDIVTMVMGMAGAAPRVFRQPGSVNVHISSDGFVMATKRGPFAVDLQSSGMSSVKSEPFTPTMPSATANTQSLASAREKNILYQRKRLCQNKTALETLYAQEAAAAQNPRLKPHERQEIVNSRHRVERQFVQVLCRLGTLEKTIPNAEKCELQTQFARKKQKQNHAAGVRIDLLGWYRKYY